MTEKKNDTKRRTKAGMLGDAARNGEEKEQAEPAQDSDNRAKISKKEAEERDDRPLH